MNTRVVKAMPNKLPRGVASSVTEIRKWPSLTLIDIFADI